MNGSDTALPPVFSALGDETRWGILVRLGRQPASASELARELPVSRQAIVKHLEALRAVGLVRAEQRGRALVHEVDLARLDEVGQSLRSIAAAWDRRLEGIRSIAESQD